MTNEFTVVGEHKENSLELLVKGADGSFYEYNPAQEQFSPVVPDENWLVTEPVDPETGDGMPMVDALSEAD